MGIIAPEQESVLHNALLSLLCLETLMLQGARSAYIFVALEVLVIQQVTGNVNLPALHRIMLRTILTVGVLPYVKLTHMV